MFFQVKKLKDEDNFLLWFVNYPWSYLTVILKADTTDGNKQLLCYDFCCPN